MCRLGLETLEIFSGTEDVRGIEIYKILQKKRTSQKMSMCRFVSDLFIWPTSDFWDGF